MFYGLNTPFILTYFIYFIYSEHDFLRDPVIEMHYFITCTVLMNIYHYLYDI